MRLLRRTIGAALLFAALIAIGCSSGNPPPPAVAPDAGPTPKLVTDLSSLSAAPIDPLKGSGAQSASAVFGGTRPSETAARAFLDKPGLVRNAGSDTDPATAQLLNDKAAEFANFSNVILDRIFAQLRIAERTEEISRTKIPTENKAVIVTAIMSKEGKLTELILEQHSGRSAIDKMVLDVCKKAIWYRNPPAEALSSAGNSRLTIEAKLENFASSDGTHWTFRTFIGLGIG